MRNFLRKIFSIKYTLNMDKFSSFLNYIAAIILVAVIFLGLYIVFNEFHSEKQMPHSVTVQVVDKEGKTLLTDKSQVNELKKVLVDIQNVSNEIKKRQAEIKAEKEENFFDKIYTAIIAIVIAIAGFFGFKSVSDIRERAIKDAKDQAESIAKLEFNNVFTTAYRAEIAKEVTDVLMFKLVKPEIEELEKRINSLEQVEEDSKGDDSKGDKKDDANNPTNPFEKK